MITIISMVLALLSAISYAYDGNLHAAMWSSVCLIWVLNVFIRDLIE